MLVSTDSVLAAGPAQTPVFKISGCEIKWSLGGARRAREKQIPILGPDGKAGVESTRVRDMSWGGRPGPELLMEGRLYL